MDQILDAFDESEETVVYEFASKGRRFANFIIDTICYYLMAILLGVVIVILADSEGSGGNIEDSVDQMGRMTEYFLGALIVIFYYLPLEYFSGGKSIGKYITKTRAVTLNNEKISFATVVKRTFCRLIPFEAFSFFGEPMTGWHDKFSGTKVIKE